MPFEFTFKVDNEEAMTVPYAPIHDQIRRNRGFVDLRGQPVRAREIVEGRGSPALTSLLVRVADVSSPVFTLGCDLGAHTEPTSVPKKWREVAGGYVQIACIRYYSTPSDAYAAFANTLVKTLEARSGDEFWSTDIRGKWVDFKFQGEIQGVCPSLWIWFFAASNDAYSATESRERLIGAIGDTLAMPSAVEQFAAVIRQAPAQRTSSA